MWIQTFQGCLCSLTRKWPCITRNWVRCGGSSQTNGPLGTCLLFWCDPCVVCFYCPRLFFTVAMSPPGSGLGTKNKPLGVDRLLACVLLWCCTVLTGWCALPSSTCCTARLVGSDGFSWLCGTNTASCLGWASVAHLLNCDHLCQLTLCIGWCRCCVVVILCDLSVWWQTVRIITWSTLWQSLCIKKHWIATTTLGVWLQVQNIGYRSVLIVVTYKEKAYLGEGSIVSDNTLLDLDFFVTFHRVK